MNTDPIVIEAGKPIRLRPDWDEQMKPTIDPEFRALIPPLTREEFAQLEANLLADGCRDSLIAWNGVLLDGHNRLEICEAHNLPYRVSEQRCQDRDDVKAWIIRNQLGRRNLRPFQRCELALKLEPLIRAKAKAQQVRKAGDSVLPKSAEQKPINTREELARASGLGHGTISQARAIVDKAPEAVKEQLRRGETTINRASREIRKKDRGGTTPQHTAKLDKSPAAAQERRRQIRELADSGHNVPQIAKAIGLTEGTCRSIISAEKIPVPAATMGKPHHHNANRIVSTMVMDAENLTADVNLIDFSALDRSRLPEWIATLLTARASLSQFIRRLTKEKENDVEAT